MKAISPMLAVVLLIAFTDAVGGILSVWLSTLSTTQTTIVSSTTEDQIKCSASSLKVSEVRYPTGTSRGSVNITVVYDSGAENLANITVESTRGGVTDAGNSTATVEPGEVRAFAITANYPPEVVSARGFCRSKVPIIGECKSGQPCMVGA